MQHRKIAKFTVQLALPEVARERQTELMKNDIPPMDQHRSQFIHVLCFL